MRCCKCLIDRSMFVRATVDLDATNAPSPAEPIDMAKRRVITFDLCVVCAMVHSRTYPAFNLESQSKHSPNPDFRDFVTELWTAEAARRAEIQRLAKLADEIVAREAAAKAERDRTQRTTQAMPTQAVPTTYTGV